MRRDTPGSTTGAPAASQALPILALAAVFFLGLWWLSSNLIQAPADQPATAVESNDSAPWPTIPPTILSINSSSSPAIAPTIQTPQWESKRALVFGSIVLSSVQSAKADRGVDVWEDKTIFLKMSYKVRFYVDLTEIRPEDVERDGNAISVMIPKPKWYRPELIGSFPLNKPGRATVDFFIGGPPQQVSDKGIADVVLQFDEESDLYRLIYDAAITNMTAMLEEELQFAKATVSIRP